MKDTLEKNKYETIQVDMGEIKKKLRGQSSIISAFSVPISKNSANKSTSAGTEESESKKKGKAKKNR
jgi:hypothetical protein